MIYTLALTKTAEQHSGRYTGNAMSEILIYESESGQTLGAGLAA